MAPNVPMYPFLLLMLDTCFFEILCNIASHTFNVHVNHLGILLKMHVLIQLVGVGGLTFCISNVIPCGADAAFLD